MNKNLKKVISSVAALTMVASSVAAFAVDFPDVELQQATHRLFKNFQLLT